MARERSVRSAGLGPMRPRSACRDSGLRTIYPSPVRRRLMSTGLCLVQCKINILYNNEILIQWFCRQLRGGCVETGKIIWSLTRNLPDIFMGYILFTCIFTGSACVRRWTEYLWLHLLMSLNSSEIISKDSVWVNQ